MRVILCCLLLLGVNLNAQSASEDKAAGGKLNSILMALKDSRAARASLAQQLGDEMMSLAGSNRKPSRATVSNFADELTDALAGKSLTSDQVSRLQSSITGMLRGSAANFNSASALREILGAAHVDSVRTQRIIKRFIAIGEEVRGPDDLPVSAQSLK
jgi:hypothetical protein